MVLGLPSFFGGNGLCFWESHRFRKRSGQAMEKGYNLLACILSSVVEHRLPKPNIRVRFPQGAPFFISSKNARLKRAFLLIPSIHF